MPADSARFTESVSGNAVLFLVPGHHPRGTRRERFKPIPAARTSDASPASPASSVREHVPEYCGAKHNNSEFHDNHLHVGPALNHHAPARCEADRCEKPALFLFAAARVSDGL